MARWYKRVANYRSCNKPVNDSRLVDHWVETPIKKLLLSAYKSLEARVHVFALYKQLLLAHRGKQQISEIFDFIAPNSRLEALLISHFGLGPFVKDLPLRAIQATIHRNQTISVITHMAIVMSLVYLRIVSLGEGTRSTSPWLEKDVLFSNSLKTHAAYDLPAIIIL